MDYWTEKETTFKSFDGTELFCRTWEPTVSSDRALILLHRGHEHSGRLTRLVETLDLKDYWGFSFDMRGHGQSPGERGYAEGYDVWVKDLDAFAKHVCRTYGIAYENIAIVANSVGAVTASTWVHDYAPDIRCMVLAAPAFRIKLYIPFAVSLLRLLLKVKPKSFIKSYVKSSMLTHDDREAKRYNDDPLITRNIAVGILLGLHDTSTRILDDAAAIHTPTLLLSAGSDCVVKTSAQKRFYDRISAPRRDMITYPDSYHAIFYEKERSKPIAAARDFIVKSFEQDVPTSFLIDGDKRGFTKDEYDSLLKPAALLKRISFGAQVAGMRTLGRLSKGIRIGLASGFDSGASLDHVYQNKACGVSPLGRIIDRGYLDAIGWKGIRARKVNLMECLKAAIDRSDGDGGPVRVLDIASGPGRYLLETAKALPNKNISLLLHDNEQSNLDAAKALAEEFAIHGVQYICGDAFDRDAVSKLTPRPHVAVVSGLYELFPSNDTVMNSLNGLADVLLDDGYLVYTCQPWHPQVEMIARTLTNRVGEPWIMRRRPQAEMNELVQQAGFEKIDTRVGPYGIFSVSVARKRRSK